MFPLLVQDLHCLSFIAILIFFSFIDFILRITKYSKYVYFKIFVILLDSYLLLMVIDDSFYCTKIYYVQFLIVADIITLLLNHTAEYTKQKCKLNTKQTLNNVMLLKVIFYLLVMNYNGFYVEHYENIPDLILALSKDSLFRIYVLNVLYIVTYLIYICHYHAVAPTISESVKNNYKIISILFVYIVFYIYFLDITDAKSITRILVYNTILIVIIFIFDTDSRVEKLHGSRWKNMIHMISLLVFTVAKIYWVNDIFEIYRIINILNTLYFVILNEKLNTRYNNLVSEFLNNEEKKPSKKALQKFVDEQYISKKNVNFNCQVYEAQLLISLLSLNLY